MIYTKCVKYFKVGRSMIKLILNILIRAMKIGVKHDENIKRDFACLPNKYTIKINILPKNISATFMYVDGAVTQLDEVDNDNINLLVEFKDEKSAKDVLLGKLSLTQSFCEHRIKVYGNINHAMAVTRIVNTLECYLYPKFVYGKLFNPVPEFGMSKFRFYTIFLFGGKV